jgi:hypothetical protein
VLTISQLLNRIILSFTWSSSRSRSWELYEFHFSSSCPSAQAWFGGQVMKTLIGSIWPSIYSELFSPQNTPSSD